MKIDATTRSWVVNDPTPHSTLPDICFATTLDGLRLQFAGGLSMEVRPTIYTSEDEVGRVTLQDKDGAVLFEGDLT